MTVPSLDGATLEISQSTTSYNPEVAALAGGGFAVLYQTTFTPDLDPDRGAGAAVRLYQADGTPIGAAFHADADTTGSHIPQTIVATPTGFAVMWLESPLVGGAQTTFVQRFDENGTRDGGPVALSNGEYGGVVGLTATPGGELVAIHANFDDDTTRVSVIETDGTLSKDFADEGMGRNSLVGDAWQAATAANGDVLFLRNTVGDRLPDMSWSRDLTLHRLDADGTLLSSSVVVDDLASPGAFMFAALPAGGAAVVEVKAGAATQLVVRLIDEDGTVSTPTTLTLDIYAEAASLIATNDGGLLALVAGGDFSAPEGLEMLAQKFDAAGEPEGELFVVNQDPDGHQVRADGAVLAGGDLIVAYESGAPGYDILGQLLDPSGTTSGSVLDDPVIENYGKGNDRARGGNNDDVMRGGSGTDRLWGQEGDDRLLGGKGGDVLFGGEGDDRLFGGSGDDRLDGGKGVDRLEGGSGADIFVIGRKSKETISDYLDGLDRIEITSGASSFDDLKFRERNDVVLVKIKGATVARLEDVDDASIFDHHDFIFS